MINIDLIPAGPELDKLVCDAVGIAPKQFWLITGTFIVSETRPPLAKRLLREQRNGNLIGKRIKQVTSYPQVSESIREAAKLLHHMHRHFRDRAAMKYEISPSRPRLEWCVSFWLANVEAWSTSLPIAICRAAYKAAMIHRWKKED